MVTHCDGRALGRRLQTDDALDRVANALLFTDTLNLHVAIRRYTTKLGRVPVVRGVAAIVTAMVSEFSECLR
jgi:hypothetical protein